MLKKYYPDEKIMKKQKKETMETRKANYKEKVRTITAVWCANVVLAAVAIIEATRGDMEKTVLFGMFTLLLTVVAILASINIKDEKKSHIIAVEKRENEVIILHDDYIEYKFNEKDKECIISAKYKTLNEEDWDVYGTFFHSSDNKVTVNTKTEKGEDSKNVHSIFIPTYFRQNEEMMEHIRSKIK